MSGALRIDRVVTSGVFELAGVTWDVDNNVSVIGDDDEVVVDAAHDQRPITEAVGDRHVTAVVCTHGHNDHVTFAPQLGEDCTPRSWCTPVTTHGGSSPIQGSVTGTSRRPANRPGGHRDSSRLRARAFIGSVCLYLPEAGALFSGDTPIAGGPGATGRSFSDFPTIIGSIRDRLFTLLEQTLVHTGQGDATTIGNEAQHLAERIARGY
ncbi:MBL fold metallo-hydrolase [Nocardia nova]|uniref:MBL fold metallo-hydrolase n=1 Tax=Nocardia nova TaxID=37330 RepID=UPI00189339B6|nr:MBL fold metallo-hydrolase [Nocardia nova]MBF6150347.1 MBL fold metallo-hydrolase [Nocardia nova]